MTNMEIVIPVCFYPESRNDNYLVIHNSNPLSMNMGMTKHKIINIHCDEFTKKQSDQNYPAIERLLRSCLRQINPLGRTKLKILKIINQIKQRG